MKEGDGMTNKEAIELLAEVDEMATKNGEDGDGFVALKIAIEALKREDHDGCDGCKHEPKDEFTFPCVICKQNFVDMYEPMPEHDREWISVNERLPEIDKRVIVTSARWGSWEIDIDSWNGKRWVKYGGYVLAWMPLPKPYGERSEE